MIHLLTSPSFQLLNEAKRKLISELPPQTTIDYIDGASIPIPEWIMTLNQGSLWGEQKCTIVSQATFVSSTNKAAMKHQDDSPLLELLNQPQPDLHLILLYQGEVDERLSLIKTIKKHHQWTHLSIPKKDGWPVLLTQWQNQLGLQLTAQAALRFLSLVYPDLDRAYQELIKLRSFAATIDEKIVSLLLRPNLEENVFELTNHLMQDHLEKALTTYQDLMILQIEPTLLISMLAKHFQLFAKVRYLLDEAKDSYAISQVLKVHEYRIKLMAQAKKRFSANRINQILLSLDALDRRIKQGKQEKQQALHWWIVRFSSLIS
jgi:DNA polymerase III subunit delta